jgi:hypothetical protein
MKIVAGGIACEHLDQDTCAFAVSSSGKRCVLEKHVKRSGEEAYTCRTSEIVADKLKDLVETDQCIKQCGLDRKTLGISSDSLLESRFTQKLCSPQCYQSCPNIVDLYFNLAAGEGKHHYYFFFFFLKKNILITGIYIKPRLDHTDQIKFRLFHANITPKNYLHLNVIV